MPEFKGKSSERNISPKPITDISQIRDNSMAPEKRKVFEPFKKQMKLFQELEAQGIYIKEPTSVNADKTIKDFVDVIKNLKVKAKEMGKTDAKLIEILEYQDLSKKSTLPDLTTEDVTKVIDNSKKYVVSKEVLELARDKGIDLRVFEQDTVQKPFYAFPMMRTDCKNDQYTLSNPKHPGQDFNVDIRDGHSLMRYGYINYSMNQKFELYFSKLENDPKYPQDTFDRVYRHCDNVAKGVENPGYELPDLSLENLSGDDTTTLNKVLFMDSTQLKSLAGILNKYGASTVLPETKEGYNQIEKAARACIAYILRTEENTVNINIVTDLLDCIGEIRKLYMDKNTRQAVSEKIDNNFALLMPTKQ